MLGNRICEAGAEMYINVNAKKVNDFQSSTVYRLHIATARSISGKSGTTHVFR